MSLPELLREAAKKQGLELRARNFRKGEVLFRQGEPPGAVHFLEEGLVRSSILAENGRELLVAISGPGECLGELEYLLGLPTVCEVRALEASSSLSVEVAVLDKLTALEPRLALGLARILAERLYKNSLRMSSRLTHPLEHGLLKATLNRLGSPRGGEGTLRKSELAEYLGATERHLSRLLSPLSEAGILAVESGRIRLLDAEAAERRMEELEG